MKKDHFQLEDYQMSPKTGCLLANPLTKLPPYFESWQKIVDSLPKLYQNKTLRDEVHKLKLLDHSKLKGNRELHLAHLQLSFITSGYVWQDGDSGVKETLPECVAVPFYQVSKQLGVKPVICHLDVCLSNWNLVDPDGPLEFSNLKCVCSMPGGAQAAHFCLVTAMVEVNFAKCLNPIVSALNLLLNRGEKKLLTEEEEKSLSLYLQSISESIVGMKKAIATMNHGLDASVFFNDIRPFLAGYGGAGSPLPDGLIFEGISKEPLEVTGGSAAQSTSLQVLDAFLGVRHTDDEAKFLNDMRHFMPPLHAKFIEDVQINAACLTSYVKSLAGPAVKDAFNQCLNSIIDFRTFHIGIVSKFILQPSRESNKKNYESLDEMGTGGSDLIPFLMKIRSDTKKKLIDTSTCLHTTSKLSFNVIAGIAFLSAAIVTFLYVNAK